MVNGIINSSQQIVTNGLVLDYDIAQLRSYPTTGTSVTDLSGNNNTGTLTNGVAFNSANGGSLVYDGINDYVNIPSNSIFNVTNISISAWFNINLLLTNQNIISRGFTALTLPYVSFVLKMNSSSPFNKCSMELSIGGTNRTLIQNSTLSINNWYNIVGTYDGTTLKSYINGSQDINTLTSVGSITAYNTPVSIGRSQLAGQYFNGKIAQTQIYNRALTATEVTQNFNANRSRYGL